MIDRSSNEIARQPDATGCHLAAPLPPNEAQRPQGPAVLRRTRHRIACWPCKGPLARTSLRGADTWSRLCSPLLRQTSPLL